MRFKDWLVLEDFDANDSDQIGDLFYPTNAGDYAYAANDPGEHWWLQWKWAQEQQQGRPFHNIDTKEFEKRGYVAVQSTSLPDGPWKNKKDQGSSVEIKKLDDLGPLKIGKNSKDRKYIKTKGVMVQWTLPLEKMFGDEPSGKWPEAASDKPWSR